MVRISELKTAEEVRAGDMQDLEYRHEYERTRLANDVAIKVIQYRVKHGLSQAALGRLLGMRQPNIARLESGDHEPSLATLSRLAEVLDQDFSVEVKPGRLRLRQPSGRKSRQTEATITALTGRAKRTAAVPAAQTRSRLAQAPSTDSARTAARKPAAAAAKSRAKSPRSRAH